MLRLLSDLLAGATAGNNSTLLVSFLKRGGIMSRLTSSLYVALFVALGIFMEGGKVSSAFSAAFPLDSIVLALLVLSTSVMIVLTCMKVPVSASQVVVSAAIGLSLSAGVFSHEYVAMVVLSWLTTFVGSFLMGHIVWSVAGAYARRRASPYFTLRLFLALALTSTALLSYTLGANTIALFISLGSSPLEAEVGAVVGVISVSLLLREGVGKIASLDPYLLSASFLSAAVIVEIYTQAGVPVSIMQAVIGATLGAAWSARRRVYVGNIKKIAVIWISVPPLCMLLGAITAAFLMR